MDFDYLIRKITEQREKRQYLNALSYANDLQKLLLKEFSDLQKGVSAQQGVHLTGQGCACVPELWLIKVMGKPKEYVQLLDFFDNPRAPWNTASTVKAATQCTVDGCTCGAKINVHTKGCPLAVDTGEVTAS